MKKSIITIGLIFSIMGLSAQSFWLKPKIIAENTWCLSDNISQKEYFCDSASAYQNFNPLLDLTKQELLLEAKAKQGINIYTIYKTSKASQEQFIWGLSSENKENQILTDYRLANLKEGKYMNFVDFNPGNIHINNFIDHDNSTEVLAIQLGGKAKRNDLPIQENTANLAEIIGLERPLSPLGKSILESSLAIKYSITLSPSSDYILAPHQGAIWDGEKDKDFHNNVAGIAKNNSLGLYQKQSKSSIENGFLIVGHKEITFSNLLNKSEFSEEQNLIWGDNQEPLNFYESDEGIPVLDRQWLFKNNGFNADHLFDLQVDETFILDQIKEDHFLWLKIQQNNDKAFYQSIENSLFSNVNLFDGSQNIQFFQVPKSWIEVDIFPANCSENINASIDLKLHGIEGQCTLILSSLVDDKEIFSTIQKEDFLHISDLSAGKYRIKIIQNNELIVSQSINIIDESIPELRIPSKYTLDISNSNVIDASYGLPAGYQYQWIKPSGQVVETSVIELNESGRYWVKIYNESCFSMTQVHVELINKNIKSLSVYPNPSPNGIFYLDLELDTAFPADIEISDVSGRTLVRRQYSGSILIEDHFQLYGNGMYFITCTSGSSVVSKKLVVQFP